MSTATATAAAPARGTLSLRVEAPTAASLAGEDAGVFEIVSAPGQHANRLQKTLVAAINGESEAIDVAPGDYTVRLFLPNGELMSERASVAPGERQEIVFELRPSLHEWLGGAAVYGGIQPLPVRDSVPMLDSIRGASDEVLDFYVSPSDPARRGGRRDARLEENARSKLRETLVEAALDAQRNWAEVESISGAARVPTIEGWRWQMRVDRQRALPGEGLSAVELVRWWSGTPLAPADPMHIVDHDSRNAKLAVADTDAGPGFRGGARRAFAAVRDPTGARHFAVFPQGWVRTSRKGRAPGSPAAATVLMTVVVDTVLRASDDPKSAARWRCAPAVDDMASMSLLGFLATGQTAAANALLRQAQEQLFEKHENPVAAAAAAFALLTYSEDRNKRERPQWRQWIGNLYKGSPFLPDGAVAMAKMYLKFGNETGSEDIDVERLREFALEAVRRGLPYLSFALAALSEILALLVRDDDAAKRGGATVAQTRQALALVRQLGRIAAPGAFFTVLRLDEDAG